MSETVSRWGRILATALITGAVTVSTGMVLFKLQEREPHLVYTVGRSAPFEGADETISILTVEIKNDGSKLVRGVTAEIEPREAEIRNSKIQAPAALQYSVEELESSLLIRVPHLNPKETIGVSLLLAGSDEPLENPNIVVRGEGVVGERGSEGERREISTLLPALVAAYAGVAFVFFLRRMKGGSLLIPFQSDESDSATHRDDQRKILAYLTAIHGDLEAARDYLTRGSRVHYWSEADYMTALAMTTAGTQALERTRKVLEDLLTYTWVTRKSRSIIHYNLARLAVASQDRAECGVQLERARELMPRLISTRLKVDKILRNYVGKGIQ